MGRTLVVWCPDWPLVAAGVPPEQPAVVLTSERVVACSAAARAAGVRAGLRRREAQARCPELIALAADPGRDARAFAPVVTAATELAPYLEMVRPGLLALDVHGPARALGGEQEVAVQLGRVVDGAMAAATRHVGSDMADGHDAGTTPPSCRIGVADGRFAAVLAARRAGPGATAPGPEVEVVPRGGDAAFLAPLPITSLTRGSSMVTGVVPWAGGDAGMVAELVELLARLGIWTLADLAALPATSVADRFGPVGSRAHRLASGDDDRPVVPAALAPDRSVRIELEEPASQVETVAFAARRPAEELITSLARRGLACTLLAIEAETEHAEMLTRRWRLPDGCTPALVVDRVRWQLDGWLSGSAGAPTPTAGVIVLRLVPVEVIEGGHQGSLLGASTGPPAEVTQTVTRLQGMLGPDAVLVGVPAGGRDPASWVVPVPFGEVDVARTASAGGAAAAVDLPWPGQLPAPAPATIPPRPLPAEVVDHAGAPVGVSGRGAVTAPPARIRVGSGPWQQVAGWAGPWPADERWWEATGRRRARVQVATDDGDAWLLVLEGGRWQVEAIYD